MLSGAWKGGKKTNKPQTNRKRGCSSCLRCLLSMCFAGRYGFNFNLFFGACCLDRCWWKTGLKQVLGVCVYVGGKCSSSLNPPPQKKNHPANENRTQSHERPRCPLFSMHRHTHAHTDVHIDKTDAKRHKHTPLANTPCSHFHLHCAALQLVSCLRRDANVREKRGTCVRGQPFFPSFVGPSSPPLVQLV